MDDSDEEQEQNEEMLLACVMAGEYLEDKEERPKYYVRDRIIEEQHIAELTAEGNDAFQRLYCFHRDCYLLYMEQSLK